MRGRSLRLWLCAAVWWTACGTEAPSLPAAPSFAPSTVTTEPSTSDTGPSGDSSPPDDSAAPTCDTTPCTGCCDGDAICVDPITDNACARPDASCTDCTVDQLVCAPDGTCINPQSLPDGAVDDRSLHISSLERAFRLRADLQHRIFGQEGIPTTDVARTTSEVADPFEASDVGPVSVERLEVDLPGGTVTPVWVITPESPSGQVVVVHQGHWHTLKEGRLSSVAEVALRNGAIVIGLTMPLYGESTGPVPTHDDLIARFPDDLPGHGIQVFLLPVSAALDWVEARHTVDSIAMVGISGGGWTALLYAAVDPRIELSIPIAGAEPLYQREGTDWGDLEQNDRAIYEVAGYLDLHVLGSLEAGRRQQVVLHRYDTCCFAGTGYQEWEPTVSQALAELSGGSFGVFLDESIRGHEVSPHALAAAVGPALTGDAARYFDDTLPAYGSFETSGSWAIDSSSGFGGDAARGTSGEARWTIALPAGDWSAALTWVPGEDFPSEVSVSWQVGAEAATAIIDQTIPPADFTAADAAWQTLASGRLDAPALLSVTLNVPRDTIVRADALRIEADWRP
ncbi:MAG: hypothetical protein CL927_00790 [Deltaproteobacteria bacterium]|nr:hypothetical protein [Deltaproteobacteria bacterium]HCH64698.1 hypothetical protein [Deltaproteobacteria bacterium]